MSERTRGIARRRILVTGSSGLIGSEVAAHFDAIGWEVHGVDNNQRAVFFGPAGDTRWNQQRLASTLHSFRHHELDIRDRQRVIDLLADIRPSAIVHAAAQPSHDRAAAIPFEDFDTNAVGTINMLEAARRACPESPFVHMSTNKIHAADVAAFIVRFIEAPRAAAVYNIGGGKANSCSILEAFAMAAERSGRAMEWVYDDHAREGDHICYYSDLRRIQADYPGWKPEVSLSETFDQIVEAWQARAHAERKGER